MSRKYNKPYNIKMLKKGSSILNQNISYAKTKKFMISVCESLSFDTTEYDPTKTITSISNYINTTERLPRMFYSVMSNYLFELDSDSHSIFFANIDTLLSEALNDTNIERDVKKIVVKLYDHAQLAYYQMDGMDIAFRNNVAEAIDDLDDELKDIQKEYITILGIFAAIMLAFVGNLTFSTSVFSSIGTAGPLKLGFTTFAVGLVFFNIIYVLLKFLMLINGKIDLSSSDFKSFKACFKWVNGLLCTALIIIALIYGCREFPKFRESWSVGQQTQEDDSSKKDHDGGGSGSGVDVNLNTGTVVES